MKKVLLYSSIALLFSVFLFSCSGNSLAERCGANWSYSAEIEQEINNLSAALTTYSQNPTTENCEAYKEAYLDYLDALRDLEECYVYTFSQDEFNQFINETEEAVNAIDCN